jgi:putative oxidoreductase
MAQCGESSNGDAALQMRWNRNITALASYLMGRRSPAGRRNSQPAADPSQMRRLQREGARLTVTESIYRHPTDGAGRRTGGVIAGLQNLGARRLAPWAPLPLRLIVGYGFAAHGFAKLMRGPDNFIGILHAMGLPMPEVLGWLTIVTEIVGGICVLLGALVPLVSIPMAIVLLVAIVTVHLPNGFSSIKLQSIAPDGSAHFGQPGYETDLLYLAGLAALVLGGSGRFAVDTILFRWIDAARRAGER